LLDLWHSYRQRLQSARASALTIRLIDELFLFPAVSIPKTARLLGVTQRSAQLNVEKIVAAGILKEATGRQRNRIFIAPEIIQIIEAQEG
jgi:Fic family protein